MVKSKTGTPSFGYERRDSKLVAHPIEAPIRRNIFELFAEHQRKKIVADILNAKGARTRNGAMFTGQTIARLLQEEKVTGVPGEAQALVSSELFERCQEILLAQERAGGAKRKVVHLFAGFVFCSCGQKMYVPSNTKKYICGDCQAKIPADDLEAIFCSQLSHYELPKNLKAEFSDLTHLWPTLSFETKREIVECVTRRIEISTKKVTCSLVIL
jgi:site-specific DNA recombinase